MEVLLLGTILKGLPEIIAIILAITTLVLVFFNNYKSNEFKRIKEQLEFLTKENRELREEVHSLYQQNKQLMDEIMNMKRELHTCYVNPLSLDNSSVE
jgi:cell division protein FtsB